MSVIKNKIIISSIKIKLDLYLSEIDEILLATNSQIGFNSIEELQKGLFTIEDKVEIAKKEILQIIEPSNQQINKLQEINKLLVEIENKIIETKDQFNKIVINRINLHNLFNYSKYFKLNIFYWLSEIFLVLYSEKEKR